MTLIGKHLLIDGYNVIHEVESLARILSLSPEAACEALIERARTIHDEEGIRVTVVFDGKEERLQLDRPCGRTSFSVIYSPRGLSADGVIEQLLTKAASPEDVTVATRDRMIREVAAARGAFSIDGQGFEDWVDRCGQRTQRRISPSGQRTQWKPSIADQLEGLGDIKRKGPSDVG